MSNLRYEIIVVPIKEQGVILSQVNLVSPAMLGDLRADEHGEVRETLICQMINTHEQKVREALIKLGWTPPADTEKTA